MRPNPVPLAVLLLASASAFAAAPPADQAGSLGCFARLDATRNGALGSPVAAQPGADGRSVLFLRSGPRDTALHLIRMDLDGRRIRELARPDPGGEQLSVAEKARRERARMTLTGITGFWLSEAGQTLLASEGGRLETVDQASGARSVLPGSDWIAPRLSPDGRFVAAVAGRALHVVSTDGKTDQVVATAPDDDHSVGLSEFAAAEELDRADGTWWSPDGGTLLYETADQSGVEMHYIADPAHPQTRPVSFRYPRAGTANAVLRLGLVSRDGGPTRWVRWDSAAFPYLGRVVWPEGKGRLSLVVLNRAQTELRVLSVDPATGQVATLLTDTDPAWINLVPDLSSAGLDLPRWLPDGSGFLWAAERGGHWQLELHHADGSPERVLTPPGLPFQALTDLDPVSRTALVTVATSRLDNALYRIPLDGGAPVPVAAEPGQHRGMATPGQHRVFVDTLDGADGRLRVLARDSATGRVLATLPSVAEAPSVPHVTYTTAGSLGFDAAIVRPRDYRSGQHYPVVLSVYGGPEVKVVEDAPRRLAPEQCLADQGFIVVSLDGRGTPGRDHDWERATKGDLIDLPLADQVDGLQALGRRFAEMDMSRVGVTGWSFGGTFTAMATVRRPDVFKVGVAGAPVTDFRDYDTAYTERYLGLPQDDASGYDKSAVLTYAAQLSRPLLLMHGLTDDNVYFENSVKLTQAFLSAGKPYSLLLLPGTHLLPDAAVHARVDEARARFLSQALGQPSR